MMKSLVEQRRDLEDVRNQSKKSIKAELAFLERRLNLLIDVLIPLRDNAKDDKQALRYVTKKMEVALGSVHMAQDKIDED